MTELYTEEYIRQPVIKKEKVFYAIDDLIKYLKEEYCPTKNRVTGVNRVIADMDKPLSESIIEQLKSDDQAFYTSVPVDSDASKSNNIVTVKVPFHRYGSDGEHLGIIIELFFMNRSFIELPA